MDLAVERVWVSVDGVTAQRYAEIRRGGELDLVRQNLQDLFTAHVQRDNNLPELGLVFVAMKSNVGELPDLRGLASRVWAADVLVTNLLPHTPDMLSEILYRRTLNLGPNALLSSVAAYASAAPRYHQADSGAYRKPDAPGAGPEPYRIRAAQRSNFCPFVQAGATAVRWDGAVSPCPPLLHTHPEYGVERWREIKHAAFGNIAEDDLGSIWRSPAYSSFRRRVHVFDFAPCTFCGGCERADSNEEDCFGNAFPVCGGCLWAQDIVRCP